MDVTVNEMAKSFLFSKSLQNYFVIHIAIQQLPTYYKNDFIQTDGLNRVMMAAEN